MSASPSSMQDIFHVFRIEKETRVDHCFALCSLFGENNIMAKKSFKE